MIHATNCTVIAIDEEGINVPKAENPKIKLKLRGKRFNVTYQDLRPTSPDNKHISQAFTILIAKFIARYTPGSNEWPEQGEMLLEIRKNMPSDRPLKARKTDTRPLGVFDVNEGVEKGVILGDWLTSNNLRAARRDRVDDVNSMERLDYAKEQSCLWHYALQATHMLMRAYYSNATTNPSSLAAHKGLLRRVWDVKSQITQLLSH
ncbi:hypothetical protein GALMADRAFT_213447 [Galerina marginata CBS 339.88]|uniref:DUF6589 domain-containing protein n=1 Tax=Galerina marginata (strain CBS 339.88) TaxID=685588 RepID=A0A067SYZ7_GALM3|nr:hypothetical protein GALMADRAFT_213447 [Galerina marginata CBS 339.88]